MLQDKLNTSISGVTVQRLSTTTLERARIAAFVWDRCLAVIPDGSGPGRSVTAEFARKHERVVKCILKTAQKILPGIKGEITDTWIDSKRNRRLVLKWDDQARKHP